jgi:hypothetical protein
LVFISIKIKKLYPYNLLSGTVVGVITLYLFLI